MAQRQWLIVIRDQDRWLEGLPKSVRWGVMGWWYKKMVRVPSEDKKGRAIKTAEANATWKQDTS